MKPFCVEITCPLHPSRKEKVWFELLVDHYFCNGCDNRNGSSVCDQCVSDMQKLHGGIPEDPIKKILGC